MERFCPLLTTYPVPAPFWSFLPHEPYWPHCLFFVQVAPFCPWQFSGNFGGRHSQCLQEKKSRFVTKYWISINWGNLEFKGQTFCSFYNNNKRWSLKQIFLNKIFDVYNLTTIPVVVGVSGKSVLLKLKTCSLYHENLLLQKFNDMYTQVPT